MNYERIEYLIDIISQSSINELHWKDQYGEIHIKRNSPALFPMDISATSSLEPMQSDYCTSIVAPMSGTVYLAPASDKAPFIQLGQVFRPGDTLFLIEAMKTMVPIIADVGGVIDAVQVKDATLVNAGDQLVSIREHIGAESTV